ncbi:hypothetical protein PanWU01x14_290810 [Parasponia andersonii]|uniref:Uncharacterized protein n=1 Tax=Parasponia andersonii TaxID=3476 RepID=A0A2P5AXN8_PARAD|nr:hypothetical protein PanWU01x14_290810 [Parasponia andersonii]
MVHRLPSQNSRSPAQPSPAQSSPVQSSPVLSGPAQTTQQQSPVNVITSFNLTRFWVRTLQKSKYIATTPPLLTRDVCLHYARVMARGIHSACTEPQTLALFSEF